ncbi:MAG: hypothetical protein FWE32_04705 [Oscillospiraceae bacterium]|nr:hypothetical protein [Oscillospiraceae bacterium]
MPSYKKMYFELFNAMTDAILALQKAQQAGEEAYINDDRQALRCARPETAPSGGESEATPTTPPTARAPRR